jgi:hypothetical protein
VIFSCKCEERRGNSAPSQIYHRVLDGRGLKGAKPWRALHTVN